MSDQKIIYGFHPVRAALKNQGHQVKALYCVAREDNPRFQEMVVLAKQAGIVVQLISKEKLQQLTHSQHHQGMAATLIVDKALTEKSLYQWLTDCPHPPLLLVLVGIQDPHNLGACLRSAESLGVDKVIISKHETAPLNALVSKVACGADQLLTIIPVSNVARCLQQMQQKGVWVIGATGEGDVDFAAVDLTEPTAIVMGPEEKGLPPGVLKGCDTRAKIPLLGKIESLNVSVATGICLYECQRQRLAPKPQLR